MIRRTSAADLLVPYVLLAALVYLVLRVSYNSLPPFQWFIAIPLAVLAGIEFVLARRVRSAVGHDPAAKPMTALAVARAVALAKASALGAAVIGGAATGLVIKVLPDASRTDASSHDLKVGLAVLVVSIVLAAAGLLLERAGIDPNSSR
jgi:Protein of unknown function (DUF3180)